MESCGIKHKTTLEAYKRLGRCYTDNTFMIDIPELPEFIKLLSEDGKVLDVGCAGGRDAGKFSKAGFDVTGIDVIDVFLAEAAKNAPQAKFVKMDLLDLKFPDDFFDAIWAHAVLLHLERKNIPRAIKEFYRVLKTGGKIHIAVKKGRDSGWEADKLVGGEKRFFTYFSKKEIENYVKKAGFKIISSKITFDPTGRKNVKWIIIWAEKAVSEKIIAVKL